MRVKSNETSSQRKRLERQISIETDRETDTQTKRERDVDGMRDKERVR